MDNSKGRVGSKAKIWKQRVKLGQNLHEGVKLKIFGKRDMDIFWNKHYTISVYPVHCNIMDVMFNNR